MTGPDPLEHLDLRALPGSERTSAPGIQQRPAPLPADAQIEATLILRRHTELDDASLATPRSRAVLAAAHGADQADVDLVVGTLSRLGVQVVSTDAASRRVRVAGTVAVLSRVFGTSLEAVTSRGPGGEEVSHRHRTGQLSVPAALDGVVTAVLGLDDRPQAGARFRTAAASSAVSFTPLQLGAVYRFPDGLDGTGQTLAILELGGGYSQAELDTYFTGLGITGPSVRWVGVDGGVNTAGADPNGADGEVLLDIEVAGALAPGARLVVYFAPNTDAGFLDALSEAAHAVPVPAAISISWGQSEDAWTTQARTAFDQALADAAALGATVTVAAGDDGSTDRVADGKSHVDFPASSPHALACGGTRLVADVTIGAVISETVWGNRAGNGATGGGVSAVFGLPAWQARAGVPKRAGARSGGAGHAGGGGRGVPDVAGVADPQTGYQVRVDGKDLVIGGTSAVAPLWAALVARLAQGTGRPLGLLQPLLYGPVTAGSVPPGFRDIVSGSNGAYSARKGWDPCTGLGVPDGTALLAALRAGA
jgi:kumamolisin